MTFGTELRRPSLRWVQARALAGIDWVRIGANVSGPLLTLAVAIVLDLLTRGGVVIPGPFPILMLTVVFAALRGGLWPGLVSALLVILYALHFLSDAGRILAYSPGNLRSLLLLMVAAPATAFLVVTGRRWTLDRLGGSDGWRGRHAADDRAVLLAEAGALLTSSGEADAGLRRVARLAVPTLADWCLVQVVDDDGELRSVVGAHREPGRELLVEALGQHSLAPVVDDKLPAPLLIDPAAGQLGRIAPGDEQQRRLEALAPGSCLLLPLVAGERVLGAILLGAGPGRWRARADLAAAEQLASGAAMAVESARLQRELAEAEHRYRLLFEDNPQPMWVFDVETLGFLAVNEAAIRQYGYSRDEFLEMSIMDVLPEEDPISRLTSVDRGAKRDHVAVGRHQRKDGVTIDVEIASHELTFGGRRARLVLVTDVTERARAWAALHQSEEQIRQVQRMDAVGRLAEGIAHDFNNLLTAIQGYSEMLLRESGTDDPRRHDLEEIRRAAERGALLTRQLLAFSRRETLRPKPVRLNDIVTAMEPLIQRLVGADIHVATVLDPDLGRIEIDPAQMEQVVINLVLNARDAMPRGGVLTLESGERHIGPSPRHRHIRPGRYAAFSATDTGTGMGDEAQVHLFEPFYTTKQMASGTGLGLSVVYGIVRRSGGFVRVSSEPGHGTTVRVFIPLLDEEPGTEPEPVQPARRGLETILLVEDEEAVRELLQKVLARQGYTVIEARHGKDALLAADRHRGRIHLLITDVVMPEMGGRELVERLQPERPDLRVLYISGYTNDEIIQRGISDPDVAFIQKPFSSDEFVNRVRALLDAPAIPTADGNG